MKELTIREIEHADSSSVGSLFHKYRIFYNLNSQVDDCIAFVSDRISNKDSVFFLACKRGGVPVAFIHMYPLFSEVTLKKIWLINDLYVEESERKNGIAKRLMQKCAEFVQESGGTELTLSTAPNNYTAQALYEKMGYIKNEKFWVYNLYL